MKTIAICASLTVAAFLLAGLQLGLFRPRTPPGDESPPLVEPPTVAEKPAPSFPADLAPLARALPVPAAAEFKIGNEPHPLVFLRLNGTLHPWQENLREDWAADTVGATELAVIVGVPKKMFIDRTDYFGGAPPITRWRYELEISVLEAKTGRILANRLFRNVPRPLMRVESWETSAIGRAVSIQQVYSWVARGARYGFPPVTDSSPIVTQAD